MLCHNKILSWCPKALVEQLSSERDDPTMGNGRSTKVSLPADTVGLLSSHSAQTQKPTRAPEGDHHVGLLFDGPPGLAGLPFN
jgi:hypothetical protein